MAEDMTDFFDSQAEQQQTPAEMPAGKPPKKERKKRQPRKARPVPAEAAPAAETPPKNGRRKRAARAEGNAKSAKVPLDIAITALAGLKPDEARMVAAAASKLGGLPKRARSRIVGALARMFG